MGRIPGYYEWDDDDLTPGQKKEGGLHQNLFDDEGKLKGSARFVPSDIDPSEPWVVTETVYVPVEERRKSKEQEELEKEIAELLTVLVIVGIEKARPHVEYWWRESVRPFVSRQWSKVRRGNTSPSEIDTSTLEAAAAEPAAGPSTDLLRDDQRRPMMSSAEAQARMLAAIAAQAFSDEQRRLVNSAEIIDQEGTETVRAAIAKMPPELLAELVKKMVTNPSLFQEESLAELASVLSRSTNPVQRELKPQPIVDKKQQRGQA